MYCILIFRKKSRGCAIAFLSSETLQVVIDIGAKPAVSPFNNDIGLTTIHWLDLDKYKYYICFAMNKSLLTAKTHTYDYLPFFYPRVFEYEGSSRKVWWHCFRDNMGEAIPTGNFDPKIATFCLDSGYSNMWMSKFKKGLAMSPSGRDPKDITKNQFGLDFSNATQIARVKSKLMILNCTCGNLKLLRSGIHVFPLPRLLLWSLLLEKLVPSERLVY
ncbi:monodehydroascorbate reductase 6 [Artemisia annua]|uniref:Monodehydroascorbate reductase 6 n=1 Tax=Artemisia annua TaxID=35608 RepID=A0A2U1LR03_ARTAN|nr:monodehydroascorbate reductase 6 [Artemisia annua]